MTAQKTLKHVAIIPDGNRRWARGNGWQAWKGHQKAGSYENLIALLKAAKELGIEYISLWGFSTENWKRDKKELDKLFEVILNGVNKLIEEVDKEKIWVRHVGRKDRLPKELVKKINELEEKSKKFEDIKVLLCVDYGGRDEIVRAVNKALNEGKRELNEEEFGEHLDAAGIPEPDLIIRTGGEKRTSGFMPFQSDYSELYFTDVYFPDFGPKELKEAVEEFSRRQRRFGK